MRIDLREQLAPEFVGARVFLNGVDVTNECFLVDTDKAQVGLYVRGLGGHFCRGPDGAIVQEIRRGVVVVVQPQSVNDGT